jgi:hypothetical protein
MVGHTRINALHVQMLLTLPVQTSLILFRLNVMAIYECLNQHIS